MNKSAARAQSKTLAILFAVMTGVAAIPGSAHAGFFESLFGVDAPSARQAPAYSYDAPVGEGVLAPRETHRARKHVAQDDKPVLQKTTDIWHDRTLRDGDAFMMKDGLHVFIGSRGSEPHARDLPRIDTAAISKKERAVLFAMDTTRNDPLTSGAAPDTVASGRSAAVASAVVDGYKITDARGHSVRYVGP